jgi:hypothetical protein
MHGSIVFSTWLCGNMSGDNLSGVARNKVSNGPKCHGREVPAAEGIQVHVHVWYLTVNVFIIEWLCPQLNLIIGPSDRTPIALCSNFIARLPAGLLGAILPASTASNLQVTSDNVVRERNPVTRWKQQNQIFFPLGSGIWCPSVCVLLVGSK